MAPIRIFCFQAKNAPQMPTIYKKKKKSIEIVEVNTN